MGELAKVYKDRIAQNPAVMVGKPVIRGTRIPAELVLGWLSGNLELDEFFEAYPDLTIDEVKAALAFGRDAVRDDYLRSRSRKEALAASHERVALATTEA